MIQEDGKKEMRMAARRDPACMGGDRAGVPSRLDKSCQQDALPPHSTLQSSTLIWSMQQDALPPHSTLQSSTLPPHFTLQFFSLCNKILYLPTLLCKILH